MVIILLYVAWFRAAGAPRAQMGFDLFKLVSSCFLFLNFFAETAQKGAQGNPGTLPESHLRAEITTAFRTAAAYLRGGSNIQILCGYYVSAFCWEISDTQKSSLEKNTSIGYTVFAVAAGFSRVCRCCV
jgi:hypothetical protein